MVFAINKASWMLGSMSPLTRGQLKVVDPLTTGTPLAALYSMLGGVTSLLETCVLRNDNTTAGLSIQALSSFCVGGKLKNCYNPHDAA
jgi:hypothetical protein